jgi:kynureninase
MSDDTPSTTPHRGDESFARELDAADPLRSLRGEFHIPKAAEIARAAGAGSLAGTLQGESVYLVGNSLGLQPRATAGAIGADLDAWARLGVEGHFHASHAWFPAHEFVREGLGRIAGANPREVVAMNSLTTNLHLLMASFYRPTRERHAIVIEDSAFPSDSYAVQSQAAFHAPHAGFDASRAVIRLKSRAGEETLRTPDILDAIDREHSRIALVMLGGVNYLTGQCFDMGEVTRFARERGIVVGWDLAHAAGNVELKLHDWGADFAAWCSYKYLNSGPGAIAGAFVHERHLARRDLPRFAGWWGTDPATRFRMSPEFSPVASADAWQLSNPPILALTPLRVSLEVFDRAGITPRRQKSLRLTAYLERLLREHAPGVRVVTPADPAARGSQLSLRVPGEARAVHGGLLRKGVVTDFREPDVIRAAPVALYNTFHDVWRFVEALRGLV